MKTRKNAEYGFTLIELMIVVAVIGIIASIALTSYQQYISRTQVSEALELMASNKAFVIEWYTVKGSWPSTAASVLQNNSGNYMASISLTSSGPSNFAFVSQMKGAGSVHSSIANKTIVLETNDNARTWVCRSGGPNPVSDKYLPAACQ